MKNLHFIQIISVVCLFLLTITKATALPAGYIIPKETLSPNHRYAFMVPVFDSTVTDSSQFQNALIDAKTDQIITKVDAPAGFDRPLNYVSVEQPLWSKDESLVLWKVNDKWCPTALVLIKLKNNKQLWQLNLLTVFQEKILSYTKKAVPKKYEVAKKANIGNGSSYPEGFTVDVEPVENGKNGLLELPIKIHITLSSNPKLIKDKPNLNSEMDAIVKNDGTIEVKKFKIL